MVSTIKLKPNQNENIVFNTITSMPHITALVTPVMEGRKEMFYLTTHSTHFIYGYMASDIWLRTIQVVRKETRCHHIGYSFRLIARVLLYAPSHREDRTYHSLCYTSRGALAGTRNSSMGVMEGKRNEGNVPLEDIDALIAHPPPSPTQMDFVDLPLHALRNVSHLVTVFMVFEACVIMDKSIQFLHLGVSFFSLK